MPGRSGVVMIAAFPPPVTGASVMSEHIAERLAGVMGVERADVASNRGGVGYHVHRVAKHIFASAHLVRARTRCDVAYFSLPSGWALLYVPWVVVAARLTRYRIVFHHHSFKYFDKRSPLLGLAVTLAGRRQAHVVLCARMGSQLARRYPRVTDVLTLSNAWAIRTAPAGDTGPGVGPVRLGHLSNLTLDKGLDTVIDVHAWMSGRAMDVSLDLAGPFTDDAAAQLVADATARDPERVVYHGAVSGSTKERFFAGVDVFVFPSRYRNEAEPLVIDEALSAGCRVVVTRRGCLCESDYQSAAVALLAVDAPVEAIAAAINAVAAQPRTTAIAEAGRRARVAEEHMGAFENWLRVS